MRKWPPMPPEQARAVWDRVVEGRRSGQAMLECGFGEATGEWLRWLLVEEWALGGSLRWSARLGHTEG